MDLREEILKLRTRRQLFKDSVTGLGAIALSSLMNEGLSAAAPTAESSDPLATKPPHFAPRAKNIIYLHMAGSLDARHVRLQAEAQPAQRSVLPRFVHPGAAVRVPQGKAQASGIATPVRAAREIGPSDLGHFAAPVHHGRRHRGRPIDVHRPVQPRPGPVIHPHGIGAAGAAEHGLLVVVRAGNGEPRPAELRRAGLGHRRAGWGRVALGQCVLADGPPRGATARRRAIRCSSSRTPRE